MWNSAQLLSTIGTWGIVMALIFSVLAAVFAFIGGVAANRASDILNKEAEVKIAQANAGAEAARLETAKIWRQVAWRRVSNEQRQAIITVLQGNSFKVSTTYVGTDPEATIFRNEIDEALREAGIETSIFSGWVAAVGLTISGKPSPEREMLSEAFAAAGFDFVVTLPERTLASELAIIVGTRPSPQR